MERRRSKRIAVNLNAERISGDKKHSIFIEDISESGIHIITAPSPTSRKYAPGVDIEVRFRISEGKRITLHCKTRWAYCRMLPEKNVDSIGLEIIRPPAEYLEFIRTLSRPGI
ncbi:MAG TPA: PilZ domain-containing protein [Dissulfurispiraceae bacterium]|nr:PilZ domain-containing protein [Dissulfurispiraceae bacterium]